MTTPATITDLSDHVEWFKREVAVPGTFTSLFPTTTDDDLAAALVDGLYRAKLDGWLPTAQADPDSFEVDAELPLEAVAVVVLYAGIKFVQNQLTNLRTAERYEAPGVVSDVQRSASVLSERLKELQAEKKDLLEMARGMIGGRPRTSVVTQDGYAIRAYTIPMLR